MAMRNNRLRSCYFVALHVAILVMLINTDAIERVKAKLFVKDSAQQLSSITARASRVHRRMDGSVPKGSVVFIGDSMVESLVTSAVAEPSVNYGVGGDTTEGVLSRMTLYNSINDAKAVVLALGVNDLKLNVPSEEIIGNYQSILDSIPAQTAIVVNALHPVDEMTIKHSIANADIIGLNAELAQLVASYPNATFTDLSAQLADGQGQLASQNHVGDGLHLSTEGYRIWIEQLKDVLE